MRRIAMIAALFFTFMFLFQPASKACVADTDPLYTDVSNFAIFAKAVQHKNTQETEKALDAYIGSMGDNPANQNPVYLDSYIRNTLRAYGAYMACRSDAPELKGSKLGVVLYGRIKAIEKNSRCEDFRRFVNKEVLAEITKNKDVPFNEKKYSRHVVYKE